jgi:hypothetical protein
MAGDSIENHVFDDDHIVTDRNSVLTSRNVNPVKNKDTASDFEMEMSRGSKTMRFNSCHRNQPILKTDLLLDLGQLSESQNQFANARFTNLWQWAWDVNRLDRASRKRQCFQPEQS